MEWVIFEDFEYCEDDLRVFTQRFLSAARWKMPCVPVAILPTMLAVIRNSMCSGQEQITLVHVIMSYCSRTGEEKNYLPGRRRTPSC
jgi:hypothetical protein